MHDRGVVEQRAVAFLDLIHALAEVGELRREELIERDEFVRLRVGDVVTARKSLFTVSRLNRDERRAVGE
ncbi:MAG: hypothetical protein ACKOJD_08750 [Candidatus Limnocylindrus sp.]